ncbi:MAG: hypothetical protein ACFNZW_09185, partial [Coriobacteriaceae bacterium]
MPKRNGGLPVFSIAFPQQGHERASFAASLPGTVRMHTAFLHLLVDVPNSSGRALSFGFPVCTKLSSCE